jgi:hypothetical protein
LAETNELRNGVIIPSNFFVVKPLDILHRGGFEEAMQPGIPLGGLMSKHALRWPSMHWGGPEESASIRAWDLWVWIEEDVAAELTNGFVEPDNPVTTPSSDTLHGGLFEAMQPGISLAWLKLKLAPRCRSEKIMSCQEGTVGRSETGCLPRKPEARKIMDWSAYIDLPLWQDRSGGVAGFSIAARGIAGMLCLGSWLPLEHGVSIFFTKVLVFLPAWESFVAGQGRHSEQRSNKELTEVHSKNSLDKELNNHIVVGHLEGENPRAEGTNKKWFRSVA